jgi:outer membrane protein TolC
MDVEFAKNDLLPQVNLNARYTHSGIGGVQTFRDEFGNIIDVKRGGFPNAMGQLFGYNFTGYSVGFNVSIPLTNKAAQSDYTRVVLQHRLLDDQRAAQSQAIALEVQNAHSQVEMNRVSIEAAHKSLELARRQLSAEERKNQLGISPIKFVLDAQNEMTAAETREIQAVIQYTQALVRYDQAIGRTLQKNSVGVEKELRFAED